MSPLSYRFGTHVSGVTQTNRTMAVNNTSPFGELGRLKMLKCLICFSISDILTQLR